MSYLSDDDLIAAVTHQVKTNAGFRTSLAQTVDTKDASWLSNLLRGALNALKVVGEFALSAFLQSLFSN